MFTELLDTVEMQKLLLDCEVSQADLDLYCILQRDLFLLWKQSIREGETYPNLLYILLKKKKKKKKKRDAPTKIVPYLNYSNKQDFFFFQIRTRPIPPHSLAPHFVTN